MMHAPLDCFAAASEAGLNSSRLEELSQVARTAAELGGTVLMQHYGRLDSIQQKSRAGDLVTNADLAAEAAVLESVPYTHLTLPTIFRV